MLVTAMFCKWCEMAAFEHNDRGKASVWTDASCYCCAIQGFHEEEALKASLGQRPKRAKSSDKSELSGLENVLFNDFIDDELDSEDASEQRASA